MKKSTLIMSILALGGSWSASAQMVFDHIKTDEVNQSLSQYVKQKNTDQWFAYSLPAAPNTSSMCCYNHGEQSACDLNNKQSGFGSSSESPDTDHIHVFVQLKQGKVDRIMPVGDHCEVKADGITVDFLNNVSEQQSIDWLKSQVLANKRGDDSGSLYVLSLHSDEKAAKTLFELASDNGGEYSEQSIFWLGQRHQDGFSYLSKLYEAVPVGELRRKINFALSQNNTNEAISLLKQIAQHDQDDEQQADAIFWLSQTDKVADLPEFLIGMMSTTESDEIKDKAIFSLSQINTEDANQELANLVKDHKDAEVREKALFWLAQNSPKQAKEAALNLLKLGGHESEQENAVFVLSQLPSKESSHALIKIVKGNYSRNIKKKAIFWLSQSDDANALKKLEELL